MPTMRGAVRLLSLVNRAVYGDVLARRRLAWRFLAQNAEALSFDREGIHWTGPVTSVIVEELFIHGHYQQHQIRPLKAWLERNHRPWKLSSVIVNVGANIGDSAILLASETGKRVLACEPLPSAYSFLKENVRANRLEALVQCCPIAIGTRNGTIEMVSPGDSARAEVANQGSQGFGSVSDSNVVKAQATMTTLSALLQAEGVAASQVGLVWSDTQGYESEIVASGSPLWRAGVPLWVELWPDGLDAHGGLNRFVELCQQHFKSFIRGKDISADTPERHEVKQLAEVSASARASSHRFEDILLLP
jgi:FkbM family methyltransferase